MQNYSGVTDKKGGRFGPGLGFYITTSDIAQKSKCRFRCWGAATVKKEGNVFALQCRVPTDKPHPQPTDTVHACIYLKKKDFKKQRHILSHSIQTLKKTISTLELLPAAISFGPKSVKSISHKSLCPTMLLI